MTRGTDSSDKTPMALEILTKYAQGQRNFHGVFVKNINLYRAQLAFIVLEEADLQKANLKEANLAGANLNHADLSSANLSGANLIGADLIRAKLASANLSKAFLSGANLSAANLRYADLTGVSLVGANLSAADLTGAKLDGANFQEANLSGVDLRHTNIENLELENIDLQNTILSTEQIVNLRQVGIFVETADHPFLGGLEEPSASPFSSSEPELSPFSNPPELSPFSNPPELSPFSHNLAEAEPLSSLSEGFEMMELEREAIEDQSAPLEMTHPIIQPSPPLLSQEDVNYNFDNETETLITSEAEQPEIEELELPDEETRDDAIRNLAKPEIAEKINSPLIQSIQKVLQRRTQYTFQTNLLEAYDYQCAITGCTIRPLLEAVEINPNAELASDHPSNGLVLRTDISHLFKLNLIAIDPQKLTVLIAPSLRNSEYKDFEARKIIFPYDPAKRPNKEFLAVHLQECSWYGKDLETSQNQTQSQTRTEGLIKSTFSNLSFDAIKQTLSGNPQTSTSESSLTTQPRRPSQPVSFVSPSKSPLGIILGLVGGSIVTLIGVFLFNNILAKQNNLNLTNLPVAEGKVETISVEIDNVLYKNKGIINNNSSYIPLKLITELGLEENQIPSEDLILYENNPYLKTSAVKALKINIGWNPETRTLTLTP